MKLAEIMSVYAGSNGDATTALYRRLEELGPVGEIAVNLFRACKSSERAKTYRPGRGYRGMAYERKQWSMDNLACALAAHAEALAIGWGWGLDEAQLYHCHVLYIDLPTGQVSFHAPDRGIGPPYFKAWDGIRGMGPQRICTWIALLLAPPPLPIAAAAIEAAA
jgi:hypothetical protein